MSYTKTAWQERIVATATKFLKTNETAGSVELTNDPGAITQAGTPFSVSAMNNIENELENVSKPFRSDYSNMEPITTDQELIIGPDDSVISSDGREPIEGMNLGTYIPPFVSIDGKRYPNPSCINIADIDYDDESTWPLARGSYGFFEDWENAKWKEADDWSEGGLSSVSKEGDWIKLTTTGKGWLQNISGITASSSKRMCVLLKKVDVDEVYFGYNSTESLNAKYTFSTGTITDGTNIVGIKAIKISSSLGYIIVEDINGGNDNTIVELSVTGSVYFKDIISSNDLSFTPPFGQDGHSTNDARAYPFDKWDHPISFTFKPQFDYDVSINRWIEGDNTTIGLNIGLSYRSTENLFRLAVDGVYYWYGLNGPSIDGGTTDPGDATTINSNEYLQVDHSFCAYVNTVSNTVKAWFNGNLLTDVSQTLSSFDPSSVISIGGAPLGNTPDAFYANSLISNFCVHPKTQSLPIDQSKPFYNPEKLYNKTMESALAPFGNMLGSLASSAGGIIEEGENINGSYVVFESGLKMCFSYDTYTVDINSAYGSLYIGSVSIPFPIEFTSKPVVSSGGERFDTGASWSNVGASWSTVFILYFYDITTRTSASRPLSWFAIGY